MLIFTLENVQNQQNKAAPCFKVICLACAKSEILLPHSSFSSRNLQRGTVGEQKQLASEEGLNEDSFQEQIDRSSYNLN